MAATLNVERHAAARLVDMNYAEDLILRKRKSTELPLQQLFKHVSRGARRRAASHRPRRYPLRLRLKLAAAAAASPIHKESRRRRRRRGDYATPTTGTAAAAATTTTTTTTTTTGTPPLHPLSCHLPTHKYHAKRFHFADTPWNFNIPDRSMERSERSTVKAECQQCTAHDASYMKCFQLTGPSHAFNRSKIAAWQLFPAHFNFQQGYTMDVEILNAEKTLEAVVDTFCVHSPAATATPPSSTATTTTTTCNTTCNTTCTVSPESVTRCNAAKILLQKTTSEERLYLVQHVLYNTFTKEDDIHLVRYINSCIRSAAAAAAATATAATAAAAAAAAAATTATITTTAAA